MSLKGYGSVICSPTLTSTMLEDNTEDNHPLFQKFREFRDAISSSFTEDGFHSVTEATPPVLGLLDTLSEIFQLDMKCLSFKFC